MTILPFSQITDYSTNAIQYLLELIVESLPSIDKKIW